MQKVKIKRQRKWYQTLPSILALKYSPSFLIITTDSPKQREQFRVRLPKTLSCSLKKWKPIHKLHNHFRLPKYWPFFSWKFPNEQDLGSAGDDQNFWQHSRYVFTLHAKRILQPRSHMFESELSSRQYISMEYHLKPNSTKVLSSTYFVRWHPLPPAGYEIVQHYLTPLNDCEIFREKIQKPLHHKRSSPSASTLLAKQKSRAIIFHCARRVDTHPLSRGHWGRSSRKSQPFHYSQASSALWCKKHEVNWSRVLRTMEII